MGRVMLSHRVNKSEKCYSKWSNLFDLKLLFIISFFFLNLYKYIKK